MVLDDGRIVWNILLLKPVSSRYSSEHLQVEFDHPKSLLQQEAGMLRALVEESRDKVSLYTLAGLEGDT